MLSSLGRVKYFTVIMSLYSRPRKLAHLYFLVVSNVIASTQQIHYHKLFYVSIQYSTPDMQLTLYLKSDVNMTALYPQRSVES